MKQITFWGRLGADPEAKTSKSDKQFASFRVAVNVWGQDDAEWIDVVAFGKTGETVVGNLHKGDPVLIIGDASARGWQSEGGDVVARLSVVAHKVEFLPRSEPSGEKVAVGASSSKDDIPW